MDRRELRSKFSMIHFLESNPRKQSLDNLLIEYKKEVRQEIHKEEEVIFVKGDYDGWIEKIEMPEGMNMEEAEDYFNQNYRMRAYPSQYDCTGQKFTMWFKICRQNGKMYCYHKVGVDV